MLSCLPALHPLDRVTSPTPFVTTETLPDIAQRLLGDRVLPPHLETRGSGAGSDGQYPQEPEDLRWALLKEQDAEGGVLGAPDWLGEGEVPPASSLACEVAGRARLAEGARCARDPGVRKGLVRQ